MNKAQEQRADDGRLQDWAVVLAASRGDLNAFADLYQQYSHRVFGFICRLVESRALAEDITHDVFLSLLERPGHYDAEKSSPITFLCRVARCLVIDNWRKNGRLDVEAWLVEEGLDTGGLAAHSVTPFDQTLQSESSQLIERAIGALPPLQREVVLLREKEELSYEEIALVVGSSVQIVKARLYRARRQLAEQLRPLLNGSGGV